MKMPLYSLLFSFSAMLLLAGEEKPHLTFAISKDVAWVYDERFKPSMREHLLDLQESTGSASFEVLCVGERQIDSYEESEVLKGAFNTWWRDECLEGVKRVKQGGATVARSSVSRDVRLLDGTAPGGEIVVILDWPFLEKGKAPSREAFADPKFELHVPSGSAAPTLRGKVYWYFSRSSLEVSLGDDFKRADEDEKESLLDEQKGNLARMWATYFRSKGFELKAFDIEMSSRNGDLSGSLSKRMKQDRSNDAIPPYDLDDLAAKPEHPVPEKPVPDHLHMRIEWEGPSVVLPVVIRGEERIVPVPDFEPAGDLVKRVFPSHKAVVVRGKTEHPVRSARQLWEEEKVVQRREVRLPLHEDGKADAELWLYLYFGPTRGEQSFPVAVTIGSAGDDENQVIVFEHKGLGEEGLEGADKDPYVWKQVILPEE